MKRRNTLMLAGLIPLLLAGCAATPTTMRWYELRSEPPERVPPPRPGDGTVWELSGRMRLPGALDRDTLVVADGAASVVPLVGHRWVEPLRESIPAVLAADLARLRGEGLVWPTTAPTGVKAVRRLQVDIDTLVADEARRALRLRARWWLTDTSPSSQTPTSTASPTPPTTGVADFEIELPDRSVDALAAAHRLALFRLAQRIAGTP
jgi:hypothetical protein